MNVVATGLALCVVRRERDWITSQRKCEGSHVSVCPRKLKGIIYLVIQAMFLPDG